MRVLVIPDVHLKPWMFEKAAELMKEGIADRAVCLMDIADDWGQQLNIDLYEQSYDAAAAFARVFQDTLWCCGNHDVSYLWDRLESGYSRLASRYVCRKLRALREALTDAGQMAYLHRIDSVLFSHGGLSEAFVSSYVPPRRLEEIDAVIEEVNSFGADEIWQRMSPVWYRPQMHGGLYKPEDYLQVVGHTPVNAVLRDGNLVSCDVFSTTMTGKPIGTQEFPVIDTETWELETFRTL